MERRVRFAFVAMAALIASSFASQVPIVDSQGFEGFALGSVHNQNAGYWYPSLAGAKKWVQVGGDPEFDVYYEIVDLGGSVGKALKFNSMPSPWAGQLEVEIGLQGASTPGFGSNWGQSQHVVIEFDIWLDYGNDGLSELAVRTYRNANVVEQTSIWPGGYNNNGNPAVALELRPTANDPFWPPTVMFNTTPGQWHKVKFAQGHTWTEDFGHVDVWFDDVLIAQGWRTWWYGWAGWLDDVKFLNNVQGTGVIYIDNFKVSYGEGLQIPEPATLGLLGLSSVMLLWTKRRS